MRKRWRSTKGLDNFGKVTFEPSGQSQTKVDVYVNYNPPAGALGDIGEKLGAGSRFEHALQNDLNHFARMVDEAPPGALDPTSSNYLFHSESAVAKGTTTERQDESMRRQQKEGMPRRIDKTIPQQRTEGQYRQADEAMPRRPIEEEYRRSDIPIPPQHTEGESYSFQI